MIRPSTENDSCTASRQTRDEIRLCASRCTITSGAAKRTSAIEDNFCAATAHCISTFGLRPTCINAGGGSIVIVFNAADPATISV